MRVTGEGGRTSRGREAEAARTRGRFAELLRRHAAAEAGRSQPAPRRDAPARSPPGDGLAEPRGEGLAQGRRAVPARLGPPGSSLEQLADPALAAAGRAPSPSAPPGAQPIVEPARATLALAVRAVVPAVEALRLGGREALSLDFGRALGVELRQRPGGVELSLSTSAALAPAARAELPGLLRALAGRGVPVVRAEVRSRGEPGGGRRDRR